MCDSGKKTQAEFGAALAAALAAAKRNQAWLARKLGETKGSVSGWARTGRVPKEVLPQIAALLHWDVTPGRAEDVYDIVWPARRKTAAQRQHEAECPLLSEIAGIDAERRRLRGRLQRLSDRLPCLYRSMGRGDFCCLVTATVSPIEHRKAGLPLAGALAEAVANGAVLVYFYPTDEIIESYYAKRWSFQGVVTGQGFRDGAAHLRRQVIEHLRTAGGYSGTKAVEIAYRRLGNFSAEDCPLFCPGVVTSMVGNSRPDRGHQVRVTLRPPGDDYGVLVLPDDQFIQFRHVRFARAELSRQSRLLAARQPAPPPPQSGFDRSWVDWLQRQLADEVNAMLSRQDVLMEQRHEQEHGDDAYGGIDPGIHYLI